MWRLLHRLFGWEYVLIAFAGSMVLRRVRVAPNGTRFVKLCGNYEPLNGSRATVLMTATIRPPNM